MYFNKEEIDRMISSNENLLYFMKLENKKHPDCQFAQQNIDDLQLAIKVLYQYNETRDMLDQEETRRVKHNIFDARYHSGRITAFYDALGMDFAD